MENILTQENSENNVVRKKSPVLFIAPIFILILGFVLFYFKDQLPFFNSGKKVVENSTSTEVLSPFEKLIGKDIDEIGKNVPLITEKSVNFVLANKKVSADQRPVLNDGDILIEVLGNEDSKIFKVVASKNQSFKYGVGDEFEFNPEIKPESLFVIRDINVLYRSTDKEVGGFMIPDGLKSGDKVVFNCERPTCEGGVLTWALVFENY